MLNGPVFVHRLDKTTSGLLIVAKTDYVHAKLAKLFADRNIYKEYLGIVRGRLNVMHGEIDAALKRIPGKYQMKASLAPDAKESLTEYSVLKTKGDYHFLSIIIKTGRMHQIRAHMQYIECPVVGDVKYGGMPASRVMLHAHKLSFVHPITQEQITLQSPRPKEFSKYIN